VIQVNGKVRGRFEVEAGLSADALREKALAEPSVQKFLEGKTVRKAIVVPDKLINIAVG
jgi:leucyl-tRNA synthetase